MDTYAFDGEKYKAASKHQKEWGYDLISGFSFKGDETVLDLGCGDGLLTKRLALAVPRGKVLGIDASGSMIETARKLCGDDLTFIQMDINEMDLENGFDLIFSNAALHWVKDHGRLLKNVRRALKDHGKILWDFGSSGNCSNFFAVIQKKMREDKYAEYFKDLKWPWYMPSKPEYEKLLAAAGFSAYEVTEMNRDRYFPNATEMVKWIDQPCILPFIKQIPQNLKDTFRQEVIEEMLQRTRQSDGTYFETFRRLKVCAQKSAAPQQAAEYRSSRQPPNRRMDTPAEPVIPGDNRRFAHMRKINLAAWDRALHYQIFRNSAQPQYCVTFGLDITHFLAVIKKRDLPFTFSFIFAVSKCAGQIKEFRCRFVDGGPAIFDKIDTAFTYLDKNTELFKVVTVEMTDTLEEYVALATEKEQAQKEYFTGPLGNDIFQFSAFPWVAYTHISHTDPGNKDNATPLFDWGRYHRENGKITLPFSVQVHHSFVDGIHIGRLADSLQRYLDTL